MIGIGHIGVGTMAKGRIAKFCERDDVRLVAGWSRSQRSRDEYVRLTQGRAVERWEDLLSDKEIQAVCVATPTNTHVGYAVAAMNAGKHVLVECPAVGKMDDFDAMVEATDRNGVAFYVASNYRFDGTGQAVGYAATRVGAVLMAQGDSSWDPGPARAWYLDDDSSGGVFPCTHLYQFTQFAVLGRPVSVSASFGGPARDLGVAMVAYDTGAVAVATGGFQKHGTNDFSVAGTEGLLRKDAQGTWVIEHGGDVEVVPIRSVDTTAEDNAAFIRCINGEVDWRPHAERERSIHATAVAAQRSATRGEIVHLA